MCHCAAVTARVPSLKPVVVIMWIAFGLVAVMHGPLDALGDLAGSFSCLAGVAVMGDSEESVKSVAPLGVPACPLMRRTGNLPLVILAKSAFPRLKCRPANVAIKQKLPGGELSFLLANWQFWRRTALAPRAPSLPV